jgi:flagellin
MSINSVNTNVGAMIALQSLNKTNADMAATQKRISTGQRVADSTDDGAAYAVAQSVRSTIGGLTTANHQLGNVQGLLATTQTGLNEISKTMSSMRDVLVTLSDANVTGDQRTQYISQYQSLLGSVNTALQDSGYNGKTLIGNVTGSNGVTGRVATVRNEAGASYGLASFDGKKLFTAMNYGGLAAMGTGAAGSATSAAVVASFSATAIAARLKGTAAASFITQINAVGAH